MKYLPASSLFVIATFFASSSHAQTCTAVGAVPDCTTINAPYCALSSTNTGCTLCGQSVVQCVQVCNFRLTSDEAQFIVDKHNTLRKNVAKGLETQSFNGQSQPAAADMMKLTWDPELALTAQKLADQCKMKHDANACRKTPTYGSVGQNVTWAEAKVSL